MSELISEKEVLIALANGKEVEAYVEYEANLHEWQNARELAVCDVLDGGFIFRLKPRTITINGIEVPCCGENYKEGEEVYVLDDCCGERGYIEYSVSGHNFEGLLPKLWWRTEKEIKQVVSALRFVFKGGWHESKNQKF